VVTSFTFTVHPIPPLTLFTLAWPWAAAAEVLAAWQGWSPAAPKELWSNCQLLVTGQVAGQSPYALKVTGVYAGPTAACSSALAPLLTAVGSAPSSQFVGPESYLNAMLIEAGCEGQAVAACHLAEPGSSGTLSRAAFRAKSTFINSALPASGTAAVVHAVETLASDVPQVGGGIVFDGYGGAINEVAVADTAFVHRDAIACAQYSTTYASATPDPSVVAAAHTWLTETQDAFAPYGRGSYQNYIDPDLVDWAQAYYGSNLPRLMAVKRAVDPDDFFHFAQSIPLTA
jgi:hypothetical protein